MGELNQYMRISGLFKMKVKVLLILSVLLIGFAAGSCQKVNSCAHCTEITSGYTPEDFCGPEVSVDTYIEELEGTDGQNWSCEKN